METKGDYERNYYAKLKELTRLKNGELTKEEREQEIDVNLAMIAVARQLLTDQLEHDKLQEATIGFGVDAPTHYESTLRMLTKCYFTGDRTVVFYPVQV